MNNKANWLLEYQKNGTVSQHGEDGVLKKVFEVIVPLNKYCVEFGAWDGCYLSNTWDLITNFGWSGVQIERDIHKFQTLQGTYRFRPDVVCLDTTIQLPSEGSNTLDNILSQTRTPLQFDLLSIDVDGYDYHIWDSLKVYKPRVVIIEYNGLLGHSYHIQRIPPVTGQGSSLSAIIELAKSKGYELISAVGKDLGVNAFFACKDLYPCFKIEDNSMANFIDEKGMLIKE